jgi:Zn-dependent M28 family amino/carboxypeptidase
MKVLALAAVVLALAGPDVQQDRLMETLRALPTSRAALGNADSREGLRRTEQLIETRLRELGYEPVVQEFQWALPARSFGEAEEIKPEERTYRNFSVDITGTEKPGEVLIVGAHFDAVPGTPGADDNGTGAAALLELARVLKDRRMSRTVRLVFFNLEEVGLVGSSQYVRQLREAGAVGKPAKGEGKKARERIIGMISLESIGYFSDEPNSQKSPIPPIKDVFEPPTVGDNIALVGFARDGAFVRTLERGMLASSPELKVAAFAFPVALPDLLRSDHAPFHAAGVPAVMLTDTANFRNPHYHKPTDTVETIDAERYARVVRGVVGAVEAVANAQGETAKDEPARDE